MVMVMAMAMAKSHETSTQVQAGLRIHAITGKFILVRSPNLNRKAQFVPARKPTGLAALHQIEADRAALARREKAVREAAALEIGCAVLDAVGSDIMLDQISAVLKAAKHLGYGPALVAMGATSNVKHSRAAAPAHRVHDAKA